MTGFVPGTPGPTAAVPVNYKDPMWGGFIDFLPGGALIDVAKSRDPSNVATPSLLSPGLLMGQVTSGKKWAPSWIGTTTGALTGAGTSITVSAASATEIVRRLGATGTLTLTGPATANGLARQRTVTYSAVDTGTGVVTVTALGVNQVEQINFNIASTGGNLQLNVQKTDGTFVTTANIAWNGTDATYLASINSALDTATGVTGGIVASAIPSVDTDLGIRLTYSGTGYAGLTWVPAEVALFPTSSTAAIYTPITAANNGAFVAGSMVGPVDGSQVPKSFIPPGTGIVLFINGTAPTYREFPRIPCGGKVYGPQLCIAPTDTGLQKWIERSLNGWDQAAIGDGWGPGGQFEFSWAYPLS